MKKNKLINRIKLQKIQDNCTLNIGEVGKQIPFSIKRFFYFTNSTPDLPRGCHAHKKLRQVMICLRGEVTIIARDGKKKEIATLNQASDPLLLEAMVWHEIIGMDKNTILLVLASRLYSKEDYISDYTEFIRMKYLNE